MEHQSRTSEHEQQKATERTSSAKHQHDPSRRMSSIVHLQHVAGNQAVTHLLQRTSPGTGGLLQRKCACGGSSGSTGKCAECKAQQAAVLQRRVGNQEVSPVAANGVPPIVHEVLHSPGQPLDAATRAFMESRFGHDFSQVSAPPGERTVPSTLTINQPEDHHEQEADKISDAAIHASTPAPEQPTTQKADSRTNIDFSQVRVHTDAQADASAYAINARAYTVGTDIVFRAGKFAPNTLEGQRILSHELVHVMQQSGMGGMTYAESGIQRAPDSGEDESWYEKLKHKTSELKTRAYKAIIDKMRKDKEDQIKFLRSQVTKLPQGAQKAVNTIIDMYGVVVDLLTALVLAVIGLVVGFVSGIIGLIESIIKLILGVLKFFTLLIAGIFSKQYRDRFEEYVNHVGTAISNIPDGIKQAVNNWWDKYQKASPEEQVLMGGELVGQIEALIATIGLAEAKAAQGAEAASTVGAAATGGGHLVLAPAGGLLEESVPVVVNVATPATAAATTSSIAATIPKVGLLGGGQLLMQGAGSSGGSKPPSPTEEKSLESKSDPVKQKPSDVRKRGRDILDIFAEGQGQATREGLEADVEAQQSVKTVEKPGGAPQPEKFDVGNFAHNYAEELISKDELPRGLDPEVEVRLPDGGTKRLDRVDRANGMIYEIKPNTRSQVAAGRRQLKLYIEYMNKEQPLGGGRTWQGKVVTYDRNSVVRLLKRIGWLI